ncbi:50S ribosome-binding GTPase [Rhodobacteraceae bacterium N5(2021)]|uniref:50S ribosome-binding GTPase n=1 Tax=Gymnodinialimonas phycosphaerae TaxID=2841589 RepID=A0A975YGS1_9RHOB|nr:GTPase [Gymnodinialimonas phycosphaerae]MBY4891969.1 50S ribosome-binding GTPase [Gymnodinialimonas phycosphaerae]
MTLVKTDSDPQTGKRPTIALLGEFSAGKSTLANVLLGADQSTVRVTATQAPPIWYVSGTGAPVRIGTDGSETELDAAGMDKIDLQDTCAVRMPVQAAFLEHFTIIDMPGSADPNMSPDIWDALLPLADIAVWCTPATQAWRQSEAAIWDMVPDTLRARSVLVVTRMDKVTGATDRRRILDRVERETRGLFRAVLPVSLLEVSKPIDQCEASGMGAVLRTLAGAMSRSPVQSCASLPQTAPPPSAPEKEGPKIIPRRVSAQPLPPRLRIVRRPKPQETTT